MSFPPGFVRVRHYGHVPSERSEDGWMAGAARKDRLWVRLLLCGEIGEPALRLSRRSEAKTEASGDAPTGPPGLREGIDPDRAA